MIDDATRLQHMRDAAVEAINNDLPSLVIELERILSAET